MLRRPTYQNVASRMFAGYYAYDERYPMCIESMKGCSADLHTVLTTACDLNFITLR